jgi:hypothetical protein
LDKRFSGNAPPLSLLYKRTIEWKKSAESAAKQAVVPAVPSVDAGGAANSVNAAGVNQPQSPAGNDEYEEILQCIKKIEKFITNLKHGTVV